MTPRDFAEITLMLFVIAAASAGMNLGSRWLLKKASKAVYWAVNLALIPAAVFAFGVYLRLTVERPDCGGNPHCWPEFAEGIQIAVAQMYMFAAPVICLVVCLPVTYLFARGWRQS